MRKISNQEYGIRNMESDIWNPAYEIRNTESGISNAEYRIRNVESGISNPECRIEILNVIFKTKNRLKQLQDIFLKPPTCNTGIFFWNALLGHSLISCSSTYYI